jgi:hypothetical protein
LTSRKPAPKQAFWLIRDTRFKARLEFIDTGFIRFSVSFQGMASQVVPFGALFDLMQDRRHSHLGNGDPTLVKIVERQLGAPKLSSNGPPRSLKAKNRIRAEYFTRIAIS